MTRNHDPDAEALRSAPRVLMVGESPAPSGDGPLGALDSAAGWGLARLDPHHDGTDPGKRVMVEDTLGLFDRVSLLDRFPGRRLSGKGDCWPEAEGRAAAIRALPSFAGRRVALLGRRVARSVQQAGGRPWLGLAAAPAGRWIQMGGPGEPTEICVLPHPSPLNKELNPGGPSREVLSRWLAAERQRLQGEAAWMRLDALTAYRYSDGSWLGVPVSGGPTTVLDPVAEGPAWRARVLREVAVNCTGQGRFTGRAMNVTAHHLLVDEVTGELLVATDGQTGDSDDAPRTQARASIEALTHDLREGLTHDITSPLKRRHPSYRVDERRAAAAVEGLLRVRPAPAALQAVAHRADVLVREVESAVLWGMSLGDAVWPTHLLGDPGTWERRVQSLMSQTRDSLLAEWVDRLAYSLEVLGSDLVPHLCPD